MYFKFQIGIFVACFFMQFNDMLVSSLFNCWAMATFMMFLTFRFIKLPKFVKKIFSVLMVPLVTFILRHSIFTEDDVSNTLNFLLDDYLLLEDC